MSPVSSERGGLLRAPRAEPLPHDEHDFTVDYVVTPDEIVPCGPPYRPAGVVWTALDPDKIAAIPVLAAMANKL